jgi:hypothetical protein
MARTVPTSEPTVLVAGDSWSWTKTLSTYPPSESWALNYSIRGISTLADTDVVVTPVASSYSVAVDKTKTAVLVAGAYQWTSYVTRTTERYSVENGVITVLPDLSQMTGSAGQTHIERMLILIEAKIEGRLTADHESYSINGRSIMKIPYKELLRLRSVYQAKLFRIENPGQLGPTVLAQMNNPDGTIGSSAPVVLPPWYRSLSS